MKRLNQKEISLNNITVETMEDNASFNIGKNIVTGMMSTTKTNIIIGQITGDNTKSYQVSIDSDIYDSDGIDESIVKDYGPQKRYRNRYI